MTVVMKRIVLEEVIAAFVVVPSPFNMLLPEVGMLESNEMPEWIPPVLSIW